MMASSKEIKNISMSLPEHEETLGRNGIPIQNAMSSVKRSREPGRPGRLSFKPIRLGDLTQEWLEAEKEPLKTFSEGEEIIDNDSDTQSDDNKSIEGVKNTLTDLQIKSPKRKVQQEHVSEVGNDLGVSWLETPAKTRPHEKFGVCAITPKISCRAKVLSTPSVVTQDFFTPYKIKTVKDDKSISKPKIQYSMDIKRLLRTPINSASAKNQTINSQSSTKAAVPQNPSVFTNIISNGALSQSAKDKQTLKSSMRNPVSVIHEKNNESAQGHVNNRVQFSLPATELSNEILKEIKVKNVTYIILNQLGKGGSSVVYHCYDPITKMECAIKKVNIGNDSTAVGYVNEVKVLERLQKCDRIIKMFDYELIKSEKLLLVVLERGGLDLSRILKDLANTNKHLPMHMLIFYWMEMLYAVKQIHENGIIHSDLKPGNFLQAEGVLKLIDFGIASCVQDDMTSVVKNFQVGSFNYISPEALTNEPSENCKSPSFGKPKYKVSYRSDVWSLGCILYQLVYRKTPFQHIGNMWGKLSAIVDPKHKIEYPEVDWVPSRMVTTIKKCLQYNMKSRPSVDELIQEYEDIYN